MPLRLFDLAHDYEAILALWHTAAPGVHVGMSDTRAELAKKLTRDPDLFLVWEEAGELMGSVIGGYDGRRGMVYHLAVAPAARRRGLGQQLMAEVESRLRAKGCVKCYLLIAPENLEVTAFYETCGWHEMPVRIMAKELLEH